MNMAKAILGAFVAAVIIKLFIFDFIVAEGNSMEPAIKNGSVLIVNRMQYGLRFPWQQGYIVRWAEPKQGDLVIFYSPLGDIAIKRCSAITENGKFTAQGDNSLQSYDSRSYGPISVDATIGKVLGKK
jgi:signal peptidase I